MLVEVWIRSLLFYVVSLLILTYAFIRLNRGLEATFLTRRRSVKSTFSVVAIYVVYGTVLCCIYGTLNQAVGNDDRNHDGNHKRSARTMEAILSYLVGCRYVPLSAVAISFLEDVVVEDLWIPSCGVS